MNTKEFIRYINKYFVGFHRLKKKKVLNHRKTSNA